MINSFQFSCRLSLQTKTQLYSQPVKGDGIEIPILSEISERHCEQPKDTCFRNSHARLLNYQFVKYINSISPFMRSYFKYREVPHNLRRDPVHFIPPARSAVYGTNSVHFPGSFIWNKLPPNSVKI